MKKSRGFTLIELLIVTVVIATLMAIVFRLAGTGGESTARAKTLARLQKLSNALSGYYAAFGSYPPVPLQGRSRDIYTQVDSYGAKEEGGISGSLGYGIQGTGRNEAALDSPEMRKQIEAACRAQPVAAGFPYNYKGTEVEVINALTTQYGLKSYQPIRSYGGFNKDSSDWSENNVFMFGLLSFLLPRYQFMLDGERNLYDMNHVGPWAANNRLPFLLDGTRLGAWSAANDPNDNAQSHLLMGPDNFGKTTSSKPEKRAMLEQLPSQAVCARWMPNFKGIVTSRPVPTVTEFFGVETEAPNDFGEAPHKWFVISQNGYGSESSYINGTKTVLDGWGEEFYYCSMPPYQSYQLWSSGPNTRTFPRWMEPSSSSDRKLVNDWIADDIKVGDK